MENRFQSTMQNLQQYESQAERAAMLAERSRMLAYISKLQGIIKGQQLMQATLLRRCKMLERAVVEARRAPECGNAVAGEQAADPCVAGAQDMATDGEGATPSLPSEIAKAHAGCVRNSYEVLQRHLRELGLDMPSSSATDTAPDHSSGLQHTLHALFPPSEPTQSAEALAASPPQQSLSASAVLNEPSTTASTAGDDSASDSTTEADLVSQMDQPLALSDARQAPRVSTATSSSTLDQAQHSGTSTSAASATPVPQSKVDGGGQDVPVPTAATSSTGTAERPSSEPTAGSRGGVGARRRKVLPTPLKEIGAAAQRLKSHPDGTASPATTPGKVARRRQIRAAKVVARASAGPSDGASTPHTPAPASDTSAFLAAEWRVGASSALGRAAAAMSLSPALKLRGHLSAVTCVDWHPAMAVIVSGALDGAIRMWQLSAWLRRRGSKQLVTHDIEPMRIYRGHSHPVTDLKTLDTAGAHAFGNSSGSDPTAADEAADSNPVGPSGGIFASTDLGGWLRLWRLPSATSPTTSYATSATDCLPILSAHIPSHVPVVGDSATRTSTNTLPSNFENRSLDAAREGEPLWGLCVAPPGFVSHALRMLEEDAAMISRRIEEQLPSGTDLAESGRTAEPPMIFTATGSGTVHGWLLLPQTELRLFAACDVLNGLREMHYTDSDLATVQTKFGSVSCLSFDPIHNSITLFVGFTSGAVVQLRISASHSYTASVLIPPVTATGADDDMMDAITKLLIHPSLPMLTALRRRGTVLVYNLSQQRVEGALETGKPTDTIAYDVPGLALLAGHIDGTVTAFDVATRSVLSSESVHGVTAGQGVLDLAGHRRISMVASAGMDGVVAVLDV